MSLIGDDIVVLARSWVGTPYHHQASVKQVGTDCLGLVRGVYRELYDKEPENIPAYSSDWAEASGVETMLEGANRHLERVAVADAVPGDVLIFRFRRGTLAKHAGILSAENRMVHALEGARVSEIYLGSWWRRRIAAVFRYPRVS